MGDIEGIWEFEVDFDSGTVSGWFDGDASGDISGSVSDGVIEASGSAAFGTVSWSGSFDSTGSEISGEWELAEGTGSGTWQGSEGEAPTVPDNEENKEETEAWSAYEYEEGEFYEYSITDYTQEPNVKGTISWSIESVDGDQVEVHIKYEQTEPQSLVVYEGTVTGSKDSVGINTPAGAFVGMAYTWSNEFSEEGFAVGSSWSVTVEGTTYTAEVTGKETYAGQESYVVEITVDGTTVYKSAVSIDLALPTYIAIYNEDTGDIEFEIELQEYSK
ncbi:hypothetical protein AKJ62_04640 [candidate division MSBL1 archaeon SCGC-AAA259D14]|uniref:Uncharacterized protein n=1 Tax=candidate division MSBL1 archaeon SCGC-AAA259D14 TaxID=1698261 RepID=A0A133U3E0_9EURY|nr:hypothetical protein AKJ62_04640 [candidate division MSBL1 archaeon SCGC-AAA259D14]